MSNLLNYQTKINKEERKSQQEQDSLYLLDVQLLSSLKSIPGKIIPLDNKLGQITNNNKENNQDMNRKDTYNNILKKDSINILNSLYNNDKFDINNNSLYKNNSATNNYLFNGGVNNTNLNYNLYNSYYKNSSNLIQNASSTLDNQLLLSHSNHPSILSFKSDLKNNNYLWSDIKFTQNSFTHNIFLYNNENNNMKGNINNLMNNNSKLSQLSYQFSNFMNDDLLKKKKSTTNLLKKNSNGSIQENEINNKSINQESNFFLEKNINYIKDNKIEIKENININEEEKFENDMVSLGKNKNKKIFFNIEKFYDDEDDTIYHNINNNNKNEPNILFNCYLKKKKKRKKISEIYNKYKCCHPKCECSYKTEKQLQSHHFKMTQECQQDSVQIIKLIHDSKNILKNIIKYNKKKRVKFEKLYDDFVNKISLKNYFEFIAGSHFNDDV